jgi:hypothetical protein
MGIRIEGDTPAVFKKSVDAFDCKGFATRSLRKERKE